MDSSLAGKMFVEADIKGLVIDGISVATAFAYLRRHQTSTSDYYCTHKRDGSYVGDDQGVRRKSDGEVLE